MPLMQVTHGSKVEWSQVSGHRSGQIDFKRLLQGNPGASDNFELSIVRTTGDYFTPRHRHNFDQVRFCLEGAMNFAPSRDLTAGTVGYFPEGTFYGPQQDTQGSIVLLLQMGGAAGYGFMSYQQLNSGYERLSDMGNFSGGAFSRTTAEGKTVRKDGYEAIWEYVSGRPVEYPPPRFEEPIVMRADNFKWMPAGDGYEAKQLGSFGERGLTIGFVRGAGGAFHRLGDLAAPELLFVIRGSLREISSGRELDTHSAIYVDSSDRGATFEVVEDAEILFIRMPTFN